MQMFISEEEKQETIKRINEAGVEFIHLWFTDVLGFLKTLVLSVDELDKALTEGMGFDGSSIQGYSRGAESDMIALPDTSTLQIQKWRATQETIAIMLCNIVTSDYKPFPGDPRYVLKQQLKRATDLGYEVFVGPELEFFYLSDSKDPELLDQAGYFDQGIRDMMFDLRSETVRRLREFGIRVEYSHHECAPSQHEIDLRYQEALRMADQVLFYKMLVVETAAQHGVHATFMPKPLNNEAGSGMHIHLSLFKDGENAFFDPEKEFELSDIARNFVGGLLRHAKGYTLLTNQWVNSYKRMVPGFEAPVYITWANQNRSALVRVPLQKKGKSSSTRVELRSPDPACNPYLAFAAVIAAGLEGIEQKIEPPDDINYDIFELPTSEIKARGIEVLPIDLDQATTAFENDKVIKAAMGETVTKYLIANKRDEWERFRTHVTQWEIDQYLPRL